MLTEFNPHLDQVKEIGFDELYALDILYAMADGLAVLYWHTKIDAMVIEVVLGSTPAEARKIRRSIPLEVPMASKGDRTALLNMLKTRLLI